MSPARLLVSPLSPPDPSDGRTRREPAIDGLRALAALLVGQSVSPRDVIVPLAFLQNSETYFGLSLALLTLTLPTPGQLLRLQFLSPPVLLARLRLSRQSATA